MLNIIQNNSGVSRSRNNFVFESENKFIELTKKYLKKKLYGIGKGVNFLLLDKLYLYLDIYERKLNCDSCFSNTTLSLIQKQIIKILNQLK